MPGQYYDWTCSVCALTWVVQSTGAAYQDSDIYDARHEVGTTMGYPNCVNETYGCMSAQCTIDCLGAYGLKAKQAWVNFDQAYSIMGGTTGLINPTSMYHYMAIRGVTGNTLWVANSAPGYKAVWDTMDRRQFDSLGPTQLIYLVPHD